MCKEIFSGERKPLESVEKDSDATGADKKAILLSHLVRFHFSDRAEGGNSLFEIHGFWITSPAPSQTSRVTFIFERGDFIP